MDLLQFASNHEGASRSEIIRCPIPYPGGKSKHVNKIIPLLPQRSCYVEPFGGSAAILLAKPPCHLEVYNDRYAGVVSFYRCMRDPVKYKELVEKIRMTVHSREEFLAFKNQWQNCEDDVERAFMWYYVTNYSFAAKGKEFGRDTNCAGRMAGKIVEKLVHFDAIHRRFRKVQVENMDGVQCMKDYDSKDTVFYVDPPYYGVSGSTYHVSFPKESHMKLLDFVRICKGFVAISSYPNTFYDSYIAWDNVVSFNSVQSIKGAAFTEENNLKGFEDLHGDRVSVTENVYILEAK
jgi:DNA adenine methylase